MGFKFFFCVCLCASRYMITTMVWGAVEGIAAAVQRESVWAHGSYSVAHHSAIDYIYISGL